jgi:hypothetical protein
METVPCTVNSWGSRYKTPTRNPTTNEFVMLNHDVQAVLRIMNKHSELFDRVTSMKAMNLLDKVPKIIEELTHATEPQFIAGGDSCNRSQYALVIVGDINKFIENVIDFVRDHLMRNEDAEQKWANDLWDLSIIEYEVKKLTHEMSPLADKHELPVNPFAGLEAHISDAIVAAISTSFV